MKEKNKRYSVELKKVIGSFYYAFPKAKNVLRLGGNDRIKIYAL